MDQRLFEAARRGDIETLELLLQEDPLLLDRLTVTPQDNPLHVSAFTGQAAFAAELLRHKPGLATELNQQGFSPLHIASAAGKIEVVKELVRDTRREVGLSKDKDGLVPLHSAAQRGRIDVIKELVSAFPYSLEQRTTSEETPLHVAVKNNQVEATRFLLKEIKDRKIDRGIVNWEDRDGNTVLHLATLRKQLLIVEMLIGDDEIVRGVDVNKENRSRFTAKDMLDVIIETEGGSVSEMYGIVQIFQTVEAKNAREKLKKPKRTFCNGNPFLAIRDTLFNEVKNATSEQRQTLMVVATLIATLTFSGVLQPPGGFKAEDSSNGGSQNNKPPKFFNTIFGRRNSTAGQSIMAESRTLDFTFYASFNAVGFLASVSMICLLTREYPLRNWMRLCIISIVAIYLVAIFYIAPDEAIFWLVVLLVSAFLVLHEIFKFIRSVIRGFSKINFSSP